MTNFPGALDHTDATAQDAAIRKFIKEKLRGRDRREAARQMGVSIFMLNGWIAEGRRQSRFPLCYLEAFCKVVGDDSLKRLLLGPDLSELLRLGECAANMLNGHARLRFDGSYRRE